MSAQKKLAALGLAFLLSLVGGFEGRHYTAYYDPIGIPTICFGHTAGVKIGDKKSPAECEELLASDLLAANAVVDRCVHVPLNANQRGGFVSMAYSTGHGRAGVKDGFCVLKSGREPAHIRLLRAGDYVGACNQIASWVYAGGRYFAGLAKRRNEERALCLTPVAA